MPDPGLFYERAVSMADAFRRPMVYPVSGSADVLPRRKCWSVLPISEILNIRRARAQRTCEIVENWIASHRGQLE
jgi:hypothetical protein